MYKRKCLMKIQVHISSIRRVIVCTCNRKTFLSNTFMHVLVFLIALLLFKHMCRAYCQQMDTSDTSLFKFYNNVRGISRRKVKNQSVFDLKVNNSFDKAEKPAQIFFQNQTDKQTFTHIVKDDYDTTTNASASANKYNQRHKKRTTFSWNKRHNDEEKFFEYNMDKKTESNKFMDVKDKQKLLHLVMNGLGLQDLPDMKKINISQTEYVNKYNEYLQRIHNRRKREIDRDGIKNAPHNRELNPEMRLISFWSSNISHINSYDEWPKQRRKREFKKNAKDTKHPREEDNRKHKTTTHLRFSIDNIGIESKSIKTENVEEANLRLLLIYNPFLTRRHQKNKTGKLCNVTTERNVFNYNNNKKYIINIKIYQRLHRGKRLLIDAKKFDISFDNTHLDNTHSRWIQFDVTQAVQDWLKESQSNLNLELLCDKCAKVGARILSDISSSTEDKLVPVINIITRPGQYTTIKNDLERAFSDSTSNQSSTAITGSCEHSKSKHPRCCRHSMQVVFKEIKGFEFIIQPKMFDAGYCFGRCPIRYNPAHHHAMLQGLIWKQSNGLDAPRPCCAPSKLVELEVLHVDEKDSEKLKISTWTDMRVVECACS